MGKCVFKKEWTRKYPWVKAFKGDIHKANCTVCFKALDISSMGESALKSHERGERHKTNSKSAAQSLSVQPATTSQPTSSSLCNELMIPAPESQPQASVSIAAHFNNNEVLKAEILWALRTVTTHCSYSSNDEIGNLFKTMFPDSAVAAKFSCSSRKTSYLCVFGISDYFLQLLKKDIQGYFTILFDESLNKKSQKKQMDIHVRYWDGNQVTTRFLGSQFLGHSTAEDMMTHFSKGVLESGLDIRNMIQVSMDGPNVYWKFIDILKRTLSNDYDSSIINIGSCGLHIVHNSFKAGGVASKWKIDDVFKSLYYLFHDSPARRDDYSKVTGSSVFPLKFCSHRWLENVPVCDRAFSVWQDVEKYVKAAESGKVTKPVNTSFSVVKEAVNDKFIKAKMQFFKCVSAHLQPFLASYQTDKPMVPFLSADLAGLVKALMRRFIKKEVLTACRNVDQLSKIDVSDDQNHLSYSKVDLGVLTEKALKEAQHVAAPLKPSDRNVMDFRMQCKDFLVKTTQHMLTKCPISYSLVRNLSALNPKEMVPHPDECRVKMKKVVTLLINANRLDENDCDVVLNQYDSFLDNISVFGSDKFANFNQNTDRLDEFLSTYMKVDQYCKLFEVCRMLLVLSHGQANVERGFSINKKVEVENLKEESIVAQRIICDYVKSKGGVLEVPITNALLVSAASSRRKYEQYLESEREKKRTDAEKRKMKDRCEEIEELKHKKTKNTIRH